MHFSWAAPEFGPFLGGEKVLEPAGVLRGGVKWQAGSRCGLFGAGCASSPCDGRAVGGDPPRVCSRGAPDPPESALGALAIYDMIYNMPRIYNLILYRIYNPFAISP